MTIAPGAAWTFQAGRLYAFADRLMETVVSVFMSAGVPLPDRKLITVGTPVHDCEEVVVTFQQVSKGLPGQDPVPQNCNAPSTASFEVHLVRCFPTIQGRGNLAPSPEVLTVNAEGLMVDAWLLMAAADEVNSDPLWGLSGMIYSVQAGEPQGGFVGVVLSVQAAVP